MILGANGIKMGKRYPKYVVNPSDVVREYGADTLRLYEMFMGPLEADKPWSNESVNGSRKFLERVYRLFEEEARAAEDNPNLEMVYNQTVKKVTEDYESLNFNTAISQMMIFVNAVYKEQKFPLYMQEGFVKLLNPICPHLTEEIWQTKLGHNESIAYESWPTYDESKLVVSEVAMAVQVNGKMRGKFTISKDASKEEVLNAALALDTVKKNIEGKEIRKTIVIPGKIVNIVVG